MPKNVETDRKIDWQPLRVLALKTPYTMEYLSLMARRKQLKVKKVGRLWYATLDNIREFENEMQARKEQKRENMRAKYFKKPDKALSSGRISQSAIFDQIQNELEEVLEEIREKERRLRGEYQEGISRIPLTINLEEKPARIFRQKKKAKIDFLSQEKRETEDLSEKLIMDLGKLLNTANQIQEDVEESQKHSGAREIKELEPEPGPEGDEYQIPIRGQFREKISENHTPFLSLNHPTYQTTHQREKVSLPPAPVYREPSYYPEEKKSGWGLAIMVTIISLLVVIAILFIIFILYGK
jgi:hypothetical protein